MGSTFTLTLFTLKKAFLLYVCVCMHACMYLCVFALQGYNVYIIFVHLDLIYKTAIASKNESACSGMVCWFPVFMLLIYL